MHKVDFLDGLEYYFVGGCVRDKIMKRECSDYDIEVYNIGLEELISHLRKFGEPDLVGKSFGVIKMNGYDISIPRIERQIGDTHKSFEVEFTNNKREACARRDFTMNAIMLSPNGEIIDPFNGKKDINHKILRATTDKFCEDALRVLRGMQFAARFDMKMDKLTIGYCQSLFSQYHTIPKERIWQEWYKWSISTFPEKGIELLCDTLWIKYYPAIYNCIGVVQHPEYHKETVYEHILMTLAESEIDSIIRFAVLLHDVGKPKTFEVKEGKITAHKHHEVSADLAREFLESIGCHYADQIIPLVSEHMTLHNDNVDYPLVRRLAARLEPANIQQLCDVYQADCYGRIPSKPYPEVKAKVEKVLAIAKELDIEKSKPKPIIMGRHLVDKLPPGPMYKSILNSMYELQLDGKFTTEEEGLSLLTEFLK